MIEIKRYTDMAARWMQQWRQWLPREKAREAAIVPKHSISGRALVSVIAIMTFLASLTLGAVMLVVAAAAEWQSDVSREVTIQVRLTAGKDLDASVRRAVEIARAAPGVAAVLPYSKEESSRLLEPWLGSGAILESLPVPRLIVVRIAPNRPPDFAALRAALAAEVPGASLDDHRSFSDRLRAMADTAIAIGLAIFSLVLAATVLSVSFATQGAMATNRSTVEVLHLIGAKDSYIAGEFQRHFLLLGLKGGAIGGGAAIALFILLGILGRSVFGQTAGEEAAAMFGGLSLGVGGYFIVLLQILVVAAVTAFASRQVVRTTLRTVG
jgi:cell division transport system permease protein